MSNKVNLFRGSPPETAPSVLVDWVRGIAARTYNQRDDDRVPWTRSFCVGTTGSALTGVVDRYSAEQDGGGE